MTVATPATPVPVGYGLTTVADHLSTVFARPAPVPRRLDLFWATVQGSNPTNASAGQNDHFDGSVLDTIHAQCVANGITHVVLCFGYTPTWAGGSGNGQQIPRDAANGCRDYANGSRLVTYYWHNSGYDADVTMYLEAWNEPQNGFMGTVNLALRSTYIKMLQARADACRNGNILGRSGVLNHHTSGGDLWTGGTGAGPPVGSPFRHLNWHEAIIDADPDCFDHIAIHSYSGGCPLGTNNGYDPMANDVGQLRAYADGAGRTDAQINSTEAGWFWRADGTPTKSDCGDNCNCNSYGSNAFPENIEVDVTTFATRISQLSVWKSKAAAWGLGLYFLFSQDTATSGNDGYNHAGLYQYAANRNGAAVLDTHGNPAPLTAFTTLISGGTDVTAPTIASVIVPTTTVTGDFAVAAYITDDVTPASAISVKLSKDGGSTYPITVPYGVVFGSNRVYPGSSTDGTWPDGTYHCVLRAKDAAGNTATHAFDLVVDNSVNSNLPIVTSVTPASGPPAGGTSVVIRGTGFTGVTGPGGVKVKIAGGAKANATSYTVISDTEIDAVLPPVPTAVPWTPPPMFLAFGAGKPTKAQLLKYRNQGAAGLRMSIEWTSGTDPGFKGVAANLSYYEDLFKYANGLTLLPGVTPAPGATGFAIICQFGLGKTYNGQLYNESSTNGGHPFNVPKTHAQWGASLVAHFKASNGNGLVWVWEGGNEPNHAKAGAKSGIAADQYGFYYAKFFGYLKRLARAADSACLVMCGGLGGHRDSPTDRPAWQFIGDMYAANITAGQSYDGVAQPDGIEGLFDFGCNHPYCQYLNPETDIANYLAHPDPNGKGFKGWAEMVELSWPQYIGLDSDLTFLITEHGQQNPFTDADGFHSIADAADVLQNAIKVWPTYPRSANGANPYTWFQAEDDSANTHGPFGLFDENGVAKEPLASRFHDLATGVLVP